MRSRSTSVHPVLFVTIFALTGVLGFAATAQHPSSMPPSEPSQRAAVDRLAASSYVPATVASIAANSNDNWDDRFGFPGVSGIVHAAVVAPNGDLYVGGYIQYAGNHAVRNIARWDGRRWHALGEGVDSYVHALAVAPNGDVYVGGRFVNAGTIRANGLARWSPASQTWSQVGSGVSDGYGSARVNALTFLGGNLVVGGEFTTANGVAAPDLAMWNGTTFQTFGAGTGHEGWNGAFESGSGSVYALAADGDLLYVGGNFEGVDAGKSKAIAVWNSAAQTWSPMNGGLDGGATYESTGTVFGLAVRDGTVYVGGKFGLAGPFGGGIPANNVAMWDGNAWSSFGTGLEGPFGATVQSLALAGDELYVGGDFNTAGGRQARYVAGWDGTAWFEPAGGYGGPVTAMASGADGALFVGGSFNSKAGDDVYVGSIGKWADGRWQGLGEGLGYESIGARIHALTHDGSRVYAAGHPTHAGGLPVNGVAAWNGQDWEALGLGTGATYGSGTVFDAATAPNGDIYIVGDFTTAGGQSANHIAVWNPAARTWRALGSGTNSAIYAIAIRNNDVYVGGAFSSAGGVVANHVARWDGTSWHAVGTGVGSSIDNATVHTIAIAENGHVYVGGSFSKAGGFDANGIAVWNGTNWSALGRGLTGTTGTYVEPVNDILLVGNDVYVAGDFVTAGTSSAAGVAKWVQATGWSALGTGLGGSYQTGEVLVRHGDNVYVGGDFTTAGGVPSKSIAVWNLASSSWEAMGSGVEGIVYAMTLLGNDLYVGGDITAAGGKPASGITRWTTGEAQAAAQFAVDAQALHFGNVTIGQGAQRTLTVTNPPTATGPLQITVTPPAAPFTIVSGGGTAGVAPGTNHQIVVGFSPTAEGPFNGSIGIAHNGGNAASPASVALSGTGISRGGNVVVLRSFDPEGAQQLIYAESVTPIDTGFVFGTNIFGDRAKSVTLDAPAGKASSQTMSISQIDVYFSYVKAGIANQTYTLHLYDTDAFGKPVGSPVFSQTYQLANAVGDNNPATIENATSHSFSQPVSVSTPFAVAIDFGTYGSDVILAAVAVNDPVNQRVENVWEQWSDHSWHNVSDAWTGAYSGGLPVPGSGNRGWQPWIEAHAVTSTATDSPSDLPSEYVLRQNYPNPFNPSTTIEFTLPSAGPVSLLVIDLTGREVATLVDMPMAAGVHRVRFDAMRLASGLYVYRLEAGSHVMSRLLTVLR